MKQDEFIEAVKMVYNGQGKAHMENETDGKPSGGVPADESRGVHVFGNGGRDGKQGYIQGKP